MNERKKAIVAADISQAIDCREKLKPSKPIGIDADN